MKSSFLNYYDVAAEDAFNNSLGLIARVLEKNLISIFNPLKKVNMEAVKDILETILATTETEDYNTTHKKKCEDLIAKQTYPENLTVEKVREKVMAAIASIIDLKFVQNPFFKTMNIINFEDFKEEAFLLVDNAIKDVIKEDVMPELDKKSSWSEKVRSSEKAPHGKTLQGLRMHV